MYYGQLPFGRIGFLATIDLIQGYVASRLATVIYVAMVMPILYDNSILLVQMTQI